LRWVFNVFPHDDSPAKQRFRCDVRQQREEESRPVSRVLSRTIIHLGCASPRTSSGLPGNSAGRAIVPLFGLAPSGVCPATAVASRAVRSYRTISPLPLSGRYIFCGTFRRLAPPRRYLALCPVEPGLSSPRTERLSGRLSEGQLKVKSCKSQGKSNKLQRNLPHQSGYLRAHRKGDFVKLIAVAAGQFRGHDSGVLHRQVFQQCAEHAP